MKNKIFAFLFFTIVITISISLSTILSKNETHSVYASSGSSPGAKTGSPGDINNCNQCHTGSLNPGNAVRSINSTGLVNGYVPGQTYTINVSITGTTSSKIGFEVTAEQDLTNSKTGTIIITDVPRTKTVNGGNAVTHNSSAGSAAAGGANSWSFDWTAPSVGTGSVTFYGNFNATNGNNSTSGDQVYTQSFNVSENISTGIEAIKEIVIVELFPNPANNYFQINSNATINSVEIYNLIGKKVITKNLNTKLIDIKNLNSGIYLINIITDTETITKKIIKQ